MAQPDDIELTRSARLIEQRRQRRNVITSIGACVFVTAIVAGVAIRQIANDGTPAVHLKQGGVQGTRSSLTFRIPATTTTTADVFPLVEDTTTPPAATTTVTTAPPATTTTAFVIPPGLINLLSTTTTVTVAPANVHWSASPASVSVQSGAQTALHVTATNDGGMPAVGVTACVGSAKAYAVAFSSVCAQGGQDIAPGQSQSFSTTISATSDGARTGTPLAPGRYFVTFGGAFITLNVTA